MSPTTAFYFSLYGEPMPCTTACKLAVTQTQQDGIADLNEVPFGLQLLTGLFTLQKVLSTLALLALLIGRHLSSELLLVVLPQLHC